MKKFQIAIIGGGVVGSAISYELSKYNLDVVVFEMGSDVANGSSKANSGVIHSGINSPPFSNKAHLCLEGNKIFQTLANEINFPVKWVGKFVIAKNEEEANDLKILRDNGKKNKVTGLEIIDRKKVKTKEPNISCFKALWVPSAGITLPYQFNIALAENSIRNGVKFLLETKVIGIKKNIDHFIIKTNKGYFKSDLLINCAGINCRNIIEMLEKPDFKIFPCRGEYLVLDKNHSHLVNSMIYPLPVKELGVLGVHITPTIEGNILIGPSAEFIDNLDDIRTTKEKMNILLSEAKKILPSLPDKGVINAYSGIRCKIASLKESGWADFRIEESKKTPGLINLIGIESPGLTASPAIAKKIVKHVSKYIKLKPKLNDQRNKIVNKSFSKMSDYEKSIMIKKKKNWGRIICRCENITEAEIINALSNPLRAQTLSSVKYRSRAGMGRCQGGFCTQHIIRIMEKNFNIEIQNIKLKSPNSKLFAGRTRNDKHE